LDWSGGRWNVTELQGEFNSAPGFHVDLRSRERGHYNTCNRAAVPTITSTLSGLFFASAEAFA
jgi:hypothetical protein